MKSKISSLALAVVMTTGGLSTAAAPALAETPIQTTAVQSIDAQTATTSVVRYVSASNVASVRATPGGRIIQALPRGTKVVGWQTSGSSWVSVSSGGYIHTSVLSSKKPGSSSKPAPKTGSTKYVKATGGANVRSGPSTGHSIVGAAGYGSSVKVTWVRGTEGDSWWRFTDGRGYIANSVLSGKKPGSSSKPAPAKVTRYVSASTAANVRSGPSTGYSVVGSAKRGTKVVGTLTGGWLKIGTKRYISGSVLSSSPVNSKPTPPKQRGLRAEAQWWANKVTGTSVPITWQTERWTYGSSWPEWRVAKVRGFMMNEQKIRTYHSGTAAVNMARGVAVHEAVHYLQARERGDATISPMPGRGGVPGFELEADCATLAIEAYYGKKYDMPTNYVDACTAAEYKIAKKLLRSQGVL